ncbi:hypothetical protein AUR64_06775 [Haloprofundus marisrubri]|uniref:HEAT repeat domain-containing protein n=1 Tax=Haloprofundus marisrubri TaxID=1514971 RepID=A0A0W1RBV4_9EURY|nr:HEAT repeat domain-containing protein [Haloprofundus marisrubri]KTG10881.1 hypothetical protein AUR64_06775 [Haloprofundus marisrubri]
MDDSSAPPTDRVVTLLERTESAEAVACLERFRTASAETRKRVVNSVRQLTDESPASTEPILPVLASFLVDENRSVRLTTAKLFVAIAEAAPSLLVPNIPSLASRLADDDEFYYVRARAAEALGYIALEHPTAVASPETLADLRVGLSFDEPEVKEKLAKALELVALGNPKRLRHQVSNLASHLDDERVLVRYHLCTALVVVGCEYPAALADGKPELADRLSDENVYVRGRAAEALGVLSRGTSEATSLPEVALSALRDDDESFVADRARFALGTRDGETDSKASPDSIGTVEAVNGTTDEFVERIVSPGGDDECRNCGLSFSESRPPMCPRCGVPC